MANFDNNREWANEISEKLEHCDKSTIFKYFEALEKKWTLSKTVTDSF